MRSSVIIFLLFVGLICVLTHANHHDEKRKHNAHQKSNAHHSNDKAHNNGKGKSHKKINHTGRHHEAGLRHPISFRDKESKLQCQWVCSNGNSSTNHFIELGLEILYNSSSSLFGIQSLSTHLAFILDYSSSVLIFLNSNTGVVLIVNLPSHEVIRITPSPKTQSSLWTSSTNFSTYFNKLSVPNLVKLGEQYGEKSDLFRLPEVIAKELQDVIQHLGIPLPSTEILKFFTGSAQRLRQGIAFLFKGSGAFHVENSFRRFLRFVLLIANLLDPQNSGIDFSKLELNVRDLFQPMSGIKVLLNFFSQIARQVNLSRIAQTFLSSREKILNFLTEVSGGSHNGLDGLITILVNIAKLLGGEGSIQDVFTSIIKFNATDVDEPSFGQLIHEGLDILKIQISMFNNSQSFTNIINFLEALNDNSALLNNVNISDIIKILLSPNPLDKISSIIKIISNLSPTKTIPQFFNFVTQALNSTNATNIISHLLPGFNVSQFIGNGSILQNIFHGVNLTQLLSNYGDVSQIFSSIPVFGPIISRISSAIQQEGGYIQKLFNPDAIRNIITEIIGNFSPDKGFSGIIGTLTNATQSGNPLEGIVSSVHGIIGNILGSGNTDQGQSAPPTPTHESSSSPSEPRSSEAAAQTHLNASERDIGTTETYKRSGTRGSLFNPFSLKAYLDVLAGLTLGDRNKAHHQKNHKSEEKSKA